ncbi:hypothetical protein [Streptomyces sp. NPDC059949]
MTPADLQPFDFVGVEAGEPVPAEGDVAVHDWDGPRVLGIIPGSAA